MRGPVAGLLIAFLLAGCTVGAEQDPGLLPQEARIDVDTPALRELKAQAGVEPCVQGPGAEPVEGGLPAVTLPCFGGGDPVDLSTLRGPLVVNLWASWCGPCREEMPVLQAFHEQYADRVPLLGIDYEDPQTTAAMELVVDTGVTYPLLADTQSVLSANPPFPPLRGLPLIALVDAEGVVVFVDFTRIDSIDQLVDLVNEHLGADL